MAITTGLFEHSDGGTNIEVPKQDAFEIVEKIRNQAPDVTHRLEEVANEYANKRLIDAAVKEYGDEIIDKSGKVAGVVDPKIAERELRDAELELSKVGKELENYFVNGGSDKEVARSDASLVITEIKKEASGLIFDMKSRRSGEIVDIDFSTNEPKDFNLDPGNPAVVVGRTASLVTISPETITVLNAIDEAIREKDNAAANKVDNPEKKLGFWGKVKELVGLGDNDEQQRSNPNETALIAGKTTEHEEALARIADRVSGNEKEENPKNLLQQFKQSMKEAKLRFETLAAEVFVEPAKEMVHGFEDAVRGLQDVEHKGETNGPTSPVYTGAIAYLNEKTTERSA